MPQTEETRLARQCSKGDPRAREELYKRYAARLYLLCRRYVSDADTARDLMHEALIKAILKAGSFEDRGTGSLYAWMSRIAVNLCISYLRKSRAPMEVPLEEAGELGEEPPDEDGLRSIPEDVLMGFIGSLPARRRLVFNLHCMEGLPHKEIAGMLGITTGASTSILAKARNDLAHMINNYLSAGCKATAKKG